MFFCPRDLTGSGEVSNVSQVHYCFRVVPICLGGFILCHGKSAQRRLQRKTGLAGVVRTDNTAQLNRLSKRKGFGTLRELYEDGLLSRETFKAEDSSTAMIDNYELRVLVSSDTRHYSISLMPSRGCATALFNTELGIIYRARALGCE